MLESRVPGRAQLLEPVCFMTCWRVFPPGGRLQRKRGILKGKVETPSSAMHAAFLPYKALKYANPIVHPLRPLKPPSWTPFRIKSSCDFSGIMPPLDMLQVLLVASSGERLRSVDTVECPDWSSGTQVKTLQVSRLLWLLWRHKETAGFCFRVCRCLWSVNDGSFAKSFCGSGDLVWQLLKYSGPGFGCCHLKIPSWKRGG